MSENNQNCRLCGSKALKNKGNGLLICKTCGLENHGSSNLYSENTFNKQPKIASHFLKEKRPHKSIEDPLFLDNNKNDTFINETLIKEKGLYIDYIEGYQGFLKACALELKNSLNYPNSFVNSVQKVFLAYLHSFTLEKAPIISSFIKPQLKTIPLKGKTSSFLIEILLKDLDILYTKPLFLQKILLYLEKTKEKALEQAENLYYKVIKQENPFKKTRKLSRKLLIGLLKEKGVIFDDKSLDKDFPLKSLLFLYELASSTKEIPFKKRTIPELIKELGFILPNNEEIQKKLISFVKTLEFSKKTIKSPLIPLEFNLTPIFLYFGGISIGIALLPIDIPAFIKAGRVPSFYKGFLGLKPSNIPSNAFIYKGVMRLKPFLKELLQREKQEISLFIEGMWQRVQQASKLPDKLISFAKSLGKRVFKEEDDGIELCLVVILALKLIYGLQNKGFSCLLKENEVILLKTLILSKEKEILDKGLLVKEEFKEVYGVIKEIGELPSLDSILIVI